jgi:D-sedoheptulose 7-phosphate isomerase
VSGSARALVEEMLDASAAAIVACRSLTDEIVGVANCIADAFDLGHKVLVCGNGGSAADAQHFAAELVGRFLPSHADRPPWAAIALTADSAVLTAVSNDFEYYEVFSRQVRALAGAGDVLVGISTSGSSRNVLRALEAAPTGVKRVALCGPTGTLAAAADLALRVPFEGTAYIQAAHIAVIHAICALLEDRLARAS